MHWLYSGRFQKYFNYYIEIPTYMYAVALLIFCNIQLFEIFSFHDFSNYTRVFDFKFPGTPKGVQGSCEISSETSSVSY